MTEKVVNGSAVVFLVLSEQEQRGRFADAIASRGEIAPTGIR
ncbi:MAG TPA: hypothetical protein VK211_12075 [Kamptonema sp.]|nr:hypothetical protein [Kamptonema sp.]